MMAIKTIRAFRVIIVTRAIHYSSELKETKRK